MFAAIVQLTRWKEHIPFVLPLTILGAVIALSQGYPADLKVLYVLIANILSISYAFMINDVEDAIDDNRDPKKAKQNPISSKLLTTNAAWTAIRVTAISSIFFYSLVNFLTLSIGLLILLLSHLYSWRKVRLKAYPITDIVSHSLMLGGLILVTGFTAYNSRILDIWLLAITVTLISAYGQLYNQLRDFKTDVKAGLKNTTIMLGEKNARLLMNINVILVAICILTSIYIHTFPFWLIIPLIFGGFIIHKFGPKGGKDHRGTKAIDKMGSLQTNVLILVNIVVIAWLLQVVFIKF